MTLIVRYDDSYPPERRYAVDVVLRTLLGLEYEVVPHSLPAVHILRRDDPFGRCVRVADVLFQALPEEWLTPAIVPGPPLPSCTVPEAWDPDERLVDRSIPVLFGRTCPNGEYLQRSADGVDIGIDIFGSAFFMLTRLEEVVDPERDEHGRFPASASLAARAGFLHRPIIDEYAALLARGLAAIEPRYEPRRRRGRLVLSHDVDLPRMHAPCATWRSVAGRAWDELRAGAPRRAVGRLASFAARATGWRDPYDTFDFLLAEGRRVGATATFNIMTGCSDPRFDPDYDPGAPFLRRLLHSVRDRGQRVGFHPSYATSTDLETTRREYETFRDLLEEEGVDPGPVGGRQHFLRFENPVTWRNWSAIGAEEDSTLGYPDAVGFRCGTCRAYPVFDLIARESLPLRERPLVAMDTTLLHYMKLTPTAARDRVADLARTCRRVGGDLTLLIHNSSLYSGARRRWCADVLDATGS
jgi:hypothetical protein